MGSEGSDLKNKSLFSIFFGFPFGAPWCIERPLRQFAKEEVHYSGSVSFIKSVNGSVGWSESQYRSYCVSKALFGQSLLKNRIAIIYYFPFSAIINLAYRYSLSPNLYCSFVCRWLRVSIKDRQYSGLLGRFLRRKLSWSRPQNE